MEAHQVVGIYEEHGDLIVTLSTSPRLLLDEMLWPMEKIRESFVPAEGDRGLPSSPKKGGLRTEKIADELEQQPPLERSDENDKEADEYCHGGPDSGAAPNPGTSLR